MGVMALTTVLCVSLAGKLRQRDPMPVTLVGWYWHFVDVVWVLLFVTIFLIR
jgi:heme/copper-type cytochrome/quinol oxidase subunit 3